MDTPIPRLLSLAVSFVIYLFSRMDALFGLCRCWVLFASEFGFSFLFFFGSIFAAK